MVSSQKTDLGRELEAYGHKQEEMEHEESDDDNEMSLIFKHDKKIA